MRKLLDSINYALAGIVHSFKTQRNMKIIFIIAILTIIASIITYVTRFELIVIVISISLVFFAEMINTAIESIVDMITNKYNDLARIAKNVSAGASLVVSVNALVVGYLVFYRKLDKLSLFSVDYLTNLPAHITFVTLLIVSMVVIMVKASTIKKRGTFLQGGMPSGHSAMSFSLFTSIALFSKDPIITTFSLILAVIVAESRLETGIHTLSEVIVGGIIGILITVIMYYGTNLLIF